MNSRMHIKRIHTRERADDIKESLGIQVSSNTEFSIIKISLTCSNAIKQLICLVIQTDMLN